MHIGKEVLGKKTIQTQKIENIGIEKMLTKSDEVTGWKIVILVVFVVCGVCV